MKRKNKTQMHPILNQWELEKTSLGIKCFVDGKLALTAKYGDPNSGDYTQKVKIDGERLLCSSYLEGDNCLGKGKLNEKSWDYLIIFLEKKLKRRDYIKKYTKKGIVLMQPEHNLHLAFLEIHGDAGDVLEKCKWLNKNVIKDVSLNYKSKYKIFWLQSGKNEPTKDRQRQMNDSPIKHIRTDSLDLDLEYK